MSSKSALSCARNWTQSVVSPGLQVGCQERSGALPSCPAARGVVRFQDQTESSDPRQRLPRRKSQTKSQRRPVPGDTQLRQATVEPGQVPTNRCRATSSDARTVTGGQGVTGSNPAVPTDFSNTCYPKLGTKIAQVGLIMWASRGRTAEVLPLRGSWMTGTNRWLMASVVRCIAPQLAATADGRSPTHA